LNPTGIKKDEDGREYVYSLASLDLVLSSLNEFFEDLSTRKEGDRSKFWNSDKDRLDRLPSKIAYNLRGYVGVISEEDMVLEAHKLEDLFLDLRDWFLAGMSVGKEQDALYQSLWNYEKEYVNQLVLNNHSSVSHFSSLSPKLGVQQSKEDKEKFVRDRGEFIKGRVQRKLKIFREIMFVSLNITRDMFSTAWKNI